MSEENQKIVDNVWKAFDKDGNGKLDSKEALLFINKLCKNSKL